MRAPECGLTQAGCRVGLLADSCVTVTPRLRAVGGDAHRTAARRAALHEKPSGDRLLRNSVTLE
jgi:hypothetical protein